MASEMPVAVPEVAAFLNPVLCANHTQKRDQVTAVCRNHADQVCAGCYLVQYCSKECQVADWKHSKETCKSPLIQDTWEPEWVRSGRTPAFIGGSFTGVPQVPFGGNKYLWGNMPALDLLDLKNNEGITDIDRDLHLLFAASGDLRNIIKTVVGVSSDHKGECVLVINDKEFAVVARNAIMLLVALKFEAETAVPIILHLWYSASVPHAMVKAIQSYIQPLVDDVCAKIKDKPTDSFQAKTFAVNDRKLRIVLTKAEWFQLSKYFQVPDSLSLEESKRIRSGVTLAPSRIDYYDRAMLQWSGALRQGERKFRKHGVLLPYGCSLESFDTPNPTLFQDMVWPMKDDLSPRGGWLYTEYMKHASVAKVDEFGAIFFHVRDILLEFCNKLHKVKMSFQLFSVNAAELGNHVRGLKFDRIEMANICDRGYLGPHRCFYVFAPMLKPKSENAKATIVLLFLNAAAESENHNSPNDHQELEVAMKRLEKYMPLNPTMFAELRSAKNIARHPYFIRRASCYDLLKNWDHHFNVFLRELQVLDFAKICGLKEKSKHTIVQPWPFKIGPRTTKAEFDILRASGKSGLERYMEFEQAD